MRFAYADPPYIGQAQKHYSHDPNCAEVDHIDLVQRLETYDGWALSLSTTSIYRVLSCIEQVGLSEQRGDYRICAWVKPFASFKVNVGVAYAWEPIIVRNARKRTRQQDTVRDWISANITLRRGLSGVKPDAFCYWLFEVLNLRADDDLDDLFPGSGAVSQAWCRWKNGQVIRVDQRHMMLDL